MPDRGRKSWPAEAGREGPELMGYESQGFTGIISKIH